MKKRPSVKANKVTETEGGGTSDVCSGRGPEGIEHVVAGNVTISALLCGFMLLFIGFVLQDCKHPTLLQHLCLFLAALFLEYFYWAMAKSWNLLAVRTMATTGDRIVKDQLASGPAFAAFKVLWTFQGSLFLGSNLLFTIVTLYSATQSLLNVAPILAGFAAGFLLCAFHSKVQWRKTWQGWSQWDKSVYLGEPISSKDMSRYQRMFALLMGEITEDPTKEKSAPEQRSQGNTRQPH